MEPSAFAALLRDHRVAAGLSQEALAERAGLSLQAVSALERGQRRGPRHATVAALAAALGLSAAQAAALDVAAQRQRRPRAAAVSPLSGGPRPATPILGRETDLAVLPFLLRQADVRLLTLMGPAGVGKTRVALEVAARAASTFPDGVTWVDLAPLRDSALVAPTLAARLGLRPDTGADAAGLVARLQGRDALVILDNMEQVLPAAALVQDVLDACPRLRVLATSRVRLGLRDERPYALAPLALPPPGEGDPQRVEEYAAVALFLERARAVSPGLTLTTSTAPMVAAVCRRLDGLPLALELAAALARLLPPRAMLARLSNGELVPEGVPVPAGPGAARGAATLDLLESGSWDRSERQQTMRQAIAWSYDLLTAEEQMLLRRLAVFAGGCTPEAAQAVCLRDGARDVPAGVDQLARHSLVRAEEREDGETRIVLLETIREFGLEQLEVSGEGEEARHAHAAHYLALAEEAAPEFVGPDQAVWIRRLEAERDNLRAALLWARDGAAHNVGLRLAGALYRFWSVRGYLSEGRRWLEALLAGSADAEVAAPVRAKALYAVSVLAYGQSDYARAGAACEGALALYRAVGDRRGVAAALMNLGNVALDRGTYPRAAALYEQALALWRELGDRVGIAISLDNLALLARDRGDYAQAATLGEEAVALQRALGNKRGTARALATLGLIARDQGDLAEAEIRFQEGLDIKRELGDTWEIGLALANLSGVACQRGEREAATALAEQSLALFEQTGDGWGRALALRNLGRVALDGEEWTRAARLYAESLSLSQAGGDMYGLPVCLEALAEAACAQGQHERSARLCGAATALRETTGTPLPPVERASYDNTVSVARAALGDDAFAAAWSAGQALPLERAVGEAVHGATD